MLWLSDPAQILPVQEELMLCHQTEKMLYSIALSVTSVNLLFNPEERVGICNSAVSQQHCEERYALLCLLTVPGRRGPAACDLAQFFHPCFLLFYDCIRITCKWLFKIHM